MTSQQTLSLLRDYESPNVTFVEPDGSWPMVWDRANGVHVWDPEGKRYLDLTAAFGVAAAGHANPRVVRAGQSQMRRLLHAMGDVHPHELKAQLARELSRLTFERWDAHGLGLRRAAFTGKTIFCNSGFEAVEAALKTAMLATRKPGVIVFEGAYHGLGYGALNATHRDYFRAPFRGQLAQFGHFVPFPKARRGARSARASGTSASGLTMAPGRSLSALEDQLGRLFRREKIGAILVEPVQVRGGVNIPPGWFLPLLRRMCHAHRALLILDEIYTGFGRTGKWFACEHAAVAPDLICLGKALTGGFPLSACVGRADVMDAAWPPSPGEAIHTSTFLGHPVGCAMALAHIAEMRRRRLPQHADDLGKFLLAELSNQFRVGSKPGRRPPLGVRVRAMGLLAGVELHSADGAPATAAALHIIKALLHRGFIFLPEGEHSNVISFTPPLTISKAQLRAAVRALAAILHETL